MRNLLTNAVFEKTFKAGDKFKEPDLQRVQTSYLYSDSSGAHFLDQESYETLTLTDEMVGNATDFLIGGLLLQLLKYNGNPIGLELPPVVELEVTVSEPGVRGDSSSGSVTKPATLETGLEILSLIHIFRVIATELRNTAILNDPERISHSINKVAVV